MRWFENVAGCILAVGLTIRLLPEKKYERYVRLFTGFLIILIFLQPVLRFRSADLRLEEKLRAFSQEQEKIEEQIFTEEKEIFKKYELLPETEEVTVRKIIIEKVEVTGND